MPILVESPPSGPDAWRRRGSDLPLALLHARVPPHAVLSTLSYPRGHRGVDVSTGEVLQHRSSEKQQPVTPSEAASTQERINLHTGYLLPDARHQIPEQFAAPRWRHHSCESPVITIYCKTENVSDPYAQPTIRVRIYEQPEPEGFYYLQPSERCVLELKYRAVAECGDMTECKLRQTITGQGLRSIMDDPMRLKEILAEEHQRVMMDHAQKRPLSAVYPRKPMNQERLDSFMSHLHPDTLVFPTLVTQRQKHHISLSEGGLIDDPDACRVTLDFDYRYYGYEPVHRVGVLRRSGLYAESDHPLDAEALHLGGYPFARFEIKGRPDYRAQMEEALQILSAHEIPVQSEVARHGHELYWRVMTGARDQYPLLFPRPSSGRVQ